jgi:hypothetical protein
MVRSREDKASKPLADRDARWRKENDHEFRRFLCALAVPSLSPFPTAEDFNSVTHWFDVFGSCRPPITNTDIMGLIVLRLTNEFLQVGEIHELNVALANVKALALARKTVPDKMLAAGFTAPEIVLPSHVPETTLWDVAVRVRQRWTAWFSEMLIAYGPARDERHLIVRGLARKCCYRRAADEMPAAKEAMKLLDAHLRRKGCGPANLEAEDMISELYTLDPGQVSKARLIELREDGLLDHRPRAMRDLARKAMYGASVKPEAVQDVIPNGWSRAREEDPLARIERADFLACLLNRCDKVDTYIVEHWDESNAEIGRRLNMSGQMIGKRRKGIRETATRLGESEAG